MNRHLRKRKRQRRPREDRGINVVFKKCKYYTVYTCYGKVKAQLLCVLHEVPR
jgi:hypothetical protein